VLEEEQREREERVRAHAQKLKHHAEMTRRDEPAER